METGHFLVGRVSANIYIYRYRFIDCLWFRLLSILGCSTLLMNCLI